MKSFSHNTRGFTLVELMVALAVFSTILLLCTAGVTAIARIYYKGIAQARTQDTTRIVIEDISRPLQFSTVDPTFKTKNISYLGTTVQLASLCVGTTRYSYVLGWQLKSNPSSNSNKHQIKHVLWQDTIKSGNPCPDPLDLTQDTPPADGNRVTGTATQELMGVNMRLVALSVTQPHTGLWKVRTKIIYGDQDLIAQPDLADISKDNCNSGAGSQFCALSDLSTTVDRRLP